MSARSSGVRPFGVIHCALRKHTRASSGTLSLGQNLKFPLENSSAVGFSKPVAGMSLPLRALPPSGLAPVQNKRERQSGSLGMRPRRRKHTLSARSYGWKSAPKAPRIGPRVSPTPNTSPVRLQLPMMPSGPSASWPTNIPSSSEASAAVVSTSSR